MIKFSYSIISFPWSFTSFQFVLYQLILTLFKSINLSIWSVIRRFKITILLGVFGFEFPLANKTSDNCSNLQYVLWPACQLLPWFSSSSSQPPPLPRGISSWTQGTPSYFLLWIKIHLLVTLERVKSWGLFLMPSCMKTGLV